jgi:dihydroxy-acid dehydratase
MEDFYYAGGLRGLLDRLRDCLHTDCMTVNGQTLGRNLDDAIVCNNDVIATRDRPIGPEGGVAVLRGNLAPGGAVVKHFSVPKEMHVHTGPARVFDTEDLAVEALLNRDVKPGDVVVIRYEGPRANGMPEMYYATAIIAASKELTATCAVVTDGRYSGAAKGPAVGHVTPEALDGGPIALVEDGDLVEIHVPERRLALVGTREGRLTPEQMAQVLEERRAQWVRPKARHDRGILSLYARVAGSPTDGAYLA